MHALDNIRGSGQPGEGRSSAATASTSIPTAHGAAVGAPAVPSATAAPDSQAGNDLVFSLVLRLYTGQCHHRELLLERRSKQQPGASNGGHGRVLSSTTTLPVVATAAASAITAAGRRDPSLPPPPPFTLASVVCVAAAGGHGAIGFSDEESAGLGESDDEDSEGGNGGARDPAGGSGGGDWSDDAAVAAAAVVQELREVRRIYPLEESSRERGGSFHDTTDARFPYELSFLYLCLWDVILVRRVVDRDRERTCESC